MGDERFVKITKEIAADFLDGMREEIQEMDPAVQDGANIYNSSKDAVVVSFDNDLQPFIGQSKGLNPPEDRTYIKRKIFLLKIISDSLKADERGELGGRVFITAEGAYYIEDDQVVELLNWVWPGISFRNDIMNNLFS